jgi:hypothetical protein
MIAEFFGYSLPNRARADANRDANFAARDALMTCQQAMINHYEEDH